MVGEKGADLIKAFWLQDYATKWAGSLENNTPALNLVLSVSLSLSPFIKLLYSSVTWRVGDFSKEPHRRRIKKANKKLFMYSKWLAIPQLDEYNYFQLNEKSKSHPQTLIIMFYFNSKIIFSHLSHLLIIIIAIPIWLILIHPTVPFAIISPPILRLCCLSLSNLLKTVWNVFSYSSILFSTAFILCECLYVCLCAGWLFFPKTLWGFLQVLFI